MVWYVLRMRERAALAFLNSAHPDLLPFRERGDPAWLAQYKVPESDSPTSTHAWMDEALGAGFSLLLRAKVREGGHG